MGLTLFSNVEALCTVGVVVSTPKELAQDGVVAIVNNHHD
jgi:hypothetical protein